MENIIVTRHAGLVNWLEQHGVTGKVIAQATPEDVAGKHVFGVLPMWLAVHAASVTEVSMPALRLEQRGKDITPAEMDEAGAVMKTYVVIDGDVRCDSVRCTLGCDGERWK